MLVAFSRKTVYNKREQTSLNGAVGIGTGEYR